MNFLGNGVNIGGPLRRTQIVTHNNYSLGLHYLVFGVSSVWVGGPPPLESGCCGANDTVVLIEDTPLVGGTLRFTRPAIAGIEDGSQLSVELVFDAAGIPEPPGGFNAGSHHQLHDPVSLKFSNLTDTWIFNWNPGLLKWEASRSDCPKRLPQGDDGIFRVVSNVSPMIYRESARATKKFLVTVTNVQDDPQPLCSTMNRVATLDNTAGSSVKYDGWNFRGVWEAPVVQPSPVFFLTTTFFVREFAVRGSPPNEYTDGFLGPPSMRSSFSSNSITKKFDDPINKGDHFDRDWSDWKNLSSTGTTGSCDMTNSDIFVSAEIG